jgi:superfamily II DNA helicase RecQ
MFSELQLIYVKKVQEAVAVADDDKLDTALMGLIVTLLAQDTSQLLLYESPVMHYLAVRGVNPQTKRFYPSFQYTPILAHMIWMIRLLMLEVAVSEQGWPELGLESRKEIGAVAGAVAEHIHQLRREHLCEGSFSPASSILSQLARGQAINRVQPSEANIYWSDDRQTVFYVGKGVAMAKVRTMCEALTVELQGLLHELLFHQSVSPVPLLQLVDSMGSAQQFQHKGYSFIDHPDNAHWKKSWEFLWEHMLEADEKQQLVKCGDRGSSSGSGRGQLEWADQPCKAYLAREKQFLLKLMVAMQVIGGQPARSPEIGSIKVRNSITSNRNIFVINGRVAVVTTYDKSLKRRGKVEYVFRCFPDQLSQVIAQYLVYVLPFSRVIEKTKGDFLFADEHGPWIKDQLSVAVAVATAKHLGVRLTVSGWRHVAIAIGDEHLRKASRIWKQDQEEEEGEAVEGESDGEVEQSLFEHILVRQSAHSKQTADLRYAIDGAFLNRLGPDLVSAYSQASRAWHAFLHLESRGAAVAVAVAVAGKRPASPLQQPVKRLKLEVSVAMQGLQKILGPDAWPRSDGQAHALELVHAATPHKPQIIVLGTGSGKSLLFFSVAAMASHQTVIVVVPFAALVDDLIIRARGHQLTCEEWQWQRQWKLLPQLLIVSADRAVEGDFLHFAKGLELNKQLVHVFFDECHVAVTDTSYRAKLRELWQLRYLGCRFTCLTATLLTTLEPVLRTNLLLEQAQIYRQSTMRPTIRYRVIECQQDLWEMAEPLIRGLPLPPASRGVIYVRSYTQGESVAEEMDCPFYKATATDKQELLTQWARGSGGWIVATGALGTGIDIPGVVYIIHLGRPYGLTSFMQQAGRGGRAGEISDSIVILPSSSGSGSGRGQFPAPRQELVNTYSVEAQDEAALTEYLESGSCRRAVLARHLDGYVKGADCLRTDSILCDRCQESLEQRSRPGSGIKEDSGSGSQESGIEAIYQALQLDIHRNEQLERFHQLLHAHCIYCQLMRVEGEEYSHCHRDCPHAASRNCNIEAYRQWRSQLTLASCDQCFRCGLSQSVCTAIKDQTACIYLHLMLPGLFFLQQVGQLYPICQEVGFGGEEKWQWQWMNAQGERALGQWEINWMRVWQRVAEIYLEI